MAFLRGTYSHLIAVRKKLRDELTSPDEGKLRLRYPASRPAPCDASPRTRRLPGRRRTMAIISTRNVRFILRTAVTMSQLALAITVYASPEGNPEFGFPELRRELTTAVSKIELGFFLYWWNLALAVLCALCWIAGFFWSAKRGLPLKPFAEDAVFVAAAFTLPYFQALYAMAHADTNRIWAYSLAWLTLAFLWAAQTIISGVGSKPAE